MKEPPNDPNKKTLEEATPQGQAGQSDQDGSSNPVTIIPEYKPLIKKVLFHITNNGKYTRRYIDEALFPPELLQRIKDRTTEGFDYRMRLEHHRIRETVSIVDAYRLVQSDF